MNKQHQRASEIRAEDDKFRVEDTVFVAHGCVFDVSGCLAFKSKRTMCDKERKPY